MHVGDELLQLRVEHGHGCRAGAQPGVGEFENGQQGHGFSPRRQKCGRFGKKPPSAPSRSEEHTSELQSLMRISYAVFCLKKKKNKRKRRTSGKTQNKPSQNSNTNTQKEMSNS